MALRIREFPVAREFPEPREIPVTREFPRLKLFPPVSRETGISREFPARGFPLNICALGHVGRLDPTTGTSLVRGSVRDSRPCTALCPHNSIGAMQLYCCMAMAHL